MNIENRFWYKVDKKSDTECWNWLGAKNKRGYGIIYWNKHNDGAHRYSWFLHHGEIGTFFVLHKCDNPSCVNPNHLFLGTHTDNMRDCSIKGRKIGGLGPGEKHPKAKLTETDIRYIRNCSETDSWLAKLYNVHQTTIWYIRANKTWTHIK